MLSRSFSHTADTTVDMPLQQSRCLLAMLYTPESAHERPFPSVLHKRLPPLSMNPRSATPRPAPFSCSLSAPNPFQSQSYLFFWDKFEKCNYFLENVLLTKDRPLDGRLLQNLLKEPICDGGT